MITITNLNGRRYLHRYELACLHRLRLAHYPRRLGRQRGLRHFVDVKSRRDKSYFRIGWDWITRCFKLEKPFSFQIHPYF